MPGEQIQWFPGHMAKTRRLIAENAKNVHLFIEVLDARVPVSSRNPVLPELTGGKPVLLLLNKASLPIRTRAASSCVPTPTRIPPAFCATA